MRPGQEQSRFGSGLPGDADEAAGEDRPPGPAVEPGRPPLPARRPRPERSAGAERPAGPEPPSARPTIQQPPPRRIQHPLPASLRRPLTEPATAEPSPPAPYLPAPPAPAESAPSPPAPSPPAPPPAAPPPPAPPAPAASGPVPSPPALAEPALPSSAKPGAAALPPLPARRPRADRPAPPARHVTMGTPFWADRQTRPAAAPQPPGASTGPAHQPAPAPDAPPPSAAPKPAASPRPAAPAKPAATPKAAGPPQPKAPRRPARSARRRRRVPLIALTVTAAAAITIAAAITLTRPSPRPARATAPAQAPAAVTAAARTRDQAAAWIRAQVSPAAIVACDPAMCAALQSAGLPAADLLVLGTDTPDPLGADVVVATPAVRSQFGTRLAGVYAPVVLARFGTGTAGIAIRVIAPAGAPAYQELLARDAQARRHVAAQLLGNPQIMMTPGARGQVLAGAVDSRLLLLLPALAAVHPVRVLAFADAGPGAGPAVPLRAARLAAAAVPGLTRAGYVAWLRGYVRGQRPPYDGQASVSGPVVTIQFSSPSPLGLLAGG